MKWTKRTKKIVLIILSVILIACLATILWIVFKPEEKVELFEQAAPPRIDITVPKEPEIEPEEQEKEPYVSPVDFETLWMTNTDIYAWMDIPGTDISYPLVQNDDDTFYLTHDAEGKKNSNGALFSESAYNGTSFEDPVTVIYGHRSGILFNGLQGYYADEESLEEHKEIIVYLPESELHFTVFAAVPYDNRHLLYNYDFSSKYTFKRVFNDILSVRSLEAVFPEDASVQPEEQVLILSTCSYGDTSHRFLVCAKLTSSV